MLQEALLGRPLKKKGARRGEEGILTRRAPEDTTPRLAEGGRWSAGETMGGLTLLSYAFSLRSKVELDAFSSLKVDRGAVDNLVIPKEFDHAGL